MNDTEYNSQIEKIASSIVEDKISFDEQNLEKLQKYYDFVKTNFKLEDEAVTQLVNESFLYLKIKTSSDIDPIQKGDEFGAGFS